MSRRERRQQQDDRIKMPRPPVQRISESRIAVIKVVVLISAFCLTLFDAYVSYNGFRQLQLPNHAPIVLAALILVVQLASGAIQQLGMNPFRGVGGSAVVDFFWIWTLASIYVIDIGSNAIAFGVGQYLSFWRLVSFDFDGLGMGVLYLMLAALLTFGDEILLRLDDRLIIGSRANGASARKASIDVRAYERYLQGYERRALDQADQAGEHASIDFDWLKQGGRDN